MVNILKFTFVQHVSTAAYRLTTIIVSLLIIAAGISGFVIADTVMGSEKVSDIDRVYVCDSGVLSGTDYNVLHQSGNELYKDVEFVYAESSSSDEAVKEAAEFSDHACVLEVENDKNGMFRLRVIKPEGFAAEKKSAKHLSEYIRENLSYVVYEAGGLTDVQKNEIAAGVVFEISVAGEEGNSVADEMLKNVIPLLLGVILYVLLCLYGQSVARCTVDEKDSKMMESLLVMTKPYNLIFGKILGMYLAAMLQLAVWIVSVIIGVSAGMSYSEGAGNAVKGFLNMLAEQGGFTVSAAVTGIVILFIGFLMYIALAAFAGSFASKTEEINNYFGIYTLVVVVFWMFPYMNQLSMNDHMLAILRYIPFSAPFMVPADVLVGNMSIGAAAVSGIIVLAATAVIVFLAARVYKALVLYRGEPVKMKDIAKIIKNG